MVCCCVNRRQLVCASRKAFADISSQNTVLSCGVQAQEEREGGRISRSGLGQRGEFFDDYMRVTDDLALAIELLRCSKVIGLGVHECTGLHTTDRHFDGEVLVSRYRSEILWEGKFGRRHRGGRRDLAHGRRVARSIFELLTVGDGLVRGETKVDEVVGGRQRGNLASLRSLLTILFKAVGYNCRIKSQ